MELRHLRYFIAVAEELHFARAAERLNIEQSPLSRAIKDLESELGVRLFDRNTRSTSITDAGALFLDEARHVFTTLEQAQQKVRGFAQGYHGSLRIGFSEGLAQPRFARLLAQYRHAEPDIDTRIVEMSFTEQIKQLRAGTLDIGLALAASASEDIIAQPLWRDPVVVVLPANHRLAARRKIALVDIAQEPLIAPSPDCASGRHRQISDIIRKITDRPIIADYVTGFAAMLTLVAAGCGIGFASTAETETIQRNDIAIRPLASKTALLTSYLLRPNTKPSNAVLTFLHRLRSQT